MLFPNLTLLRICASLAFLLLPLLGFAQEICDNGIDDDGDGLVDLNDREDCNCHLAPEIPSLLPNPSLEEFSSDQSGCKSSQPGGLPDGPNQANCLVGWQRASLATTDAWNAFTLPGSPPDYPRELPLPLPSGAGVAGFFVGIKDTDGIQFANSDQTLVTRYREYLASCFEEGNELQQGKDYRLTFSLGFMEPQTFDSKGKLVDIDSPSGVELSIYGVRECGQVNFGYFQGCPEEAGASGAAGYELLANVTVAGSGGAWTETTVEFTAGNDYAGFAIGGSCGADIKREHSKYYRNYYFIDNLILNQRDAFTPRTAGPVQVDGENICADEIVLTGQDHGEATYQWYESGIAMVGETERVLTLTDEKSKEGDYRLRVQWANGCALTDPVRIRRPVIPEQFPDSVNICSSEHTVSLSASKMLGADFLWSDGTTKSSIKISEPGTYAVTVTANCVQRVETIVAVAQTETPLTFRMSPEKPCLGDSVAITVESDWLLNGAMYVPSSGGFYFQDPTKPLYVVAGETESVAASVFTPCGLVSRQIVIPALEPFVAEAEVTDLNCQGPEGSIRLTITEGAASDIRWAGQVAKSVQEVSELTVKRPGEYSVTVSGDDRCNTTFTYEVVDRGFTVDVLPTDASCGNDGVASAFPTGGTPPYRAEWRTEADSPPLAVEAMVIRDLDRGDYLLRVTDSEGCSSETGFVIAGPETMRVTAVAETSGCGDLRQGTIDLDVSGGVAPYTYVLPGVTEQSEATFAGLREGTYRLTVRDAMDCEVRAEPVTVSFPGAVRVNLGEDLLIDLGETITLQAELSGAQAGDGEVSWESAISTPEAEADFYGLIATAMPEASGTIRAVITMPDGCSYSDELFVQVQNTINVYVPTAFSPNGDGVNDVLSVYSNLGVLGMEEFRVFDRWGGLVYETDEAEIDWDGTAAGKALDPGSYIYRGVVRLRRGGSMPIAGTVLITR